MSPPSACTHKMEYTTTPSPSDTSSVWDNNSRGTACGTDVGSPITPPVLYSALPATLPEQPPHQSFTSYPREMAASSNPDSSSPSPPTTKHPDPSDWISFRDIITTLWKGDNRSLSEVEQIMGEKYNFNASSRMYKQRLKEWNVGKNVTTKVLDTILKDLEFAESNGGRRETDKEEAKSVTRYLKRSKPTVPEEVLRKEKLMLYFEPYLPIDDGKDRPSRGKSSSSVRAEKPSSSWVKAERRQSPSSHPAMPWSPGAMNTQMLPGFVNQEYHTMPPFLYSSSQAPFTAPTGLPAPAQPWQPERPDQQHPTLAQHMAPLLEPTSALDQHMLDFTIRLRYANILLDDGLDNVAANVMNQCLDMVSSCLPPTPNTNNKTTTVVLLYVLSAALEMAVNFDHLRVLHTLFQHMNHACAGKDAATAEIAEGMPQLGRDDQIGALKRMRDMVSRASFGYLGSLHPVLFGVYSQAVDISIGNTPPGNKLHELRALSNSPSVLRSAYLTMWLDARMAAAVSDNLMAAEKQGIWTNECSDEHSMVFFDWRHPKESKKILVALAYLDGRVRYHKNNNHWDIAARMAGDAANFLETGWPRGPANAIAMARKFREEARPPVDMHADAANPFAQVQLAPPAMMAHGLPNVDTPTGSSTGWVPSTTATLPAVWSTNLGPPMGPGAFDLFGRWV